MAIELERLTNKVKHMDITLLAGSGGMHNLVSWVHMVETTEAIDFLDGGEIAFTTGLEIHSSDDLYELIKKMIERNVAGLVVNTGPFIETIPQHIIDYCNEKNFPLFTIPWKIHLAEVMRIFCFSITKSDQKELEVAAAFKNAITFPKQEELYVIALSQRNFHVHWTYTAIVIHIASNTKDLMTRIKNLINSISNHMKYTYKDFAIFENNLEIIGVCANYTMELLHDFTEELISFVNSLLTDQESMTIGVGKQTKSIRCLYKSYNQAYAIQKLQKNKKIDSSLYFYSDLGIYKLLMGIEDKEILLDYYENSIAPVIDYDRKNNSDLFTTMRCYLNHNGSVKETADELFVHRNTVNYKLNKIEDLLHLDLSSNQARLSLTLGCMLKDML